MTRTAALALLVLSALAACASERAAAQTPPPPSLPLSGSEVITCVQSNVPKGCTVADINAAASSAVTSFNTRTGAVVPTTGDYSIGQITGAGTFAGQDYATPPAIGGTTPAAGSFSALTDTGYTGVAASCAYFDTSGLLHGTGGACGAGSGAVNSFNGRTGIVVPTSGDYAITDITGAGTAAGYNTGTTGATLCLLNSSFCYWSGYQYITETVSGGGASLLTLINSSNTGSSEAILRLQPSTTATHDIQLRAFQGGADNILAILTQWNGSTNVNDFSFNNGLLTLSQYSTAGFLKNDTGGAVTSDPLFSDSNTWAGAGLSGTSGRQLFDLNYPTTNFPVIAARDGDGIVGARTQTILQIVGEGVGGGEVNVVDAAAYNGYAQYDAERYDRGGPNNGAVLNGEGIGNYTFEPYDGVSDSTTAGISAVATEDQVHDTNHGTAVYITYTPKADTNKRRDGITIGAGGLGGVTVGEASYQVPPTDEGAGTLNVESAYYVNGHQIADSSGRLYVTSTVAASNCGSLSGSAGCIVVNVGGATHYVPYW